MDWAKTTARRDENIYVLGFGATYISGLMVMKFLFYTYMDILFYILR